jgi:hypothetical protein
MYTVYILYFWQGNYQTNGHIRCIYIHIYGYCQLHVRCFDTLFKLLMRHTQTCRLPMLICLCYFMPCPCPHSFPPDGFTCVTQTFATAFLLPHQPQPLTSLSHAQQAKVRKGYKRHVCLWGASERKLVKSLKKALKKSWETTG